jgi:hypothetical protein
MEGTAAGDLVVAPSEWTVVGGSPPASTAMELLSGSRDRAEELVEVVSHGEEAELEVPD